MTFGKTGAPVADSSRGGQWFIGHAQRQRELIRALPNRADYAEMLPRIRLLAGKDATQTGHAWGGKNGNAAASKGVEASTFLGTIARCSQIAEPYLWVVPEIPAP